jgi:hypothetical protein
MEKDVKMKTKIAAILLAMVMILGGSVVFAEDAITPDHTISFTFYKTGDTGVTTFSPHPPEINAEVKGHMLVQYTGPHMAGLEVPPRSLIAHAKNLGANYIHVEEWAR